MTDTIAIVGMACRYPDADSPQALWENVLAKRRAFRRIPSERLDHFDYIASAGTPDKTYADRAAVIADYDFDRVKFRVTGDAYRSTDLSHWLALDIADRALGDAGFIDGAGLPRASTGVLVGNTLTGEFSRANAMRLRWPYVRRVVNHALDDAGLEPRDRTELLRALESRYKAPFPPVGEETLAGALSNTIAGRICNYFDLGGGGYVVDGACSASLLAVAHACTALAVGDLDVVVAGGVDLSLDPLEMVGFSSLGALARDEMRVYDAQSTGFWPGEGCGFVVLMRERDALAGGHRCYARISGWGISSDGRGGITRPEIAGQRLAIQRAYRSAGYGIDAVSLFEGHGTGTAIGDVVELRALAAERNGANLEAPQAVIGSVKANIGHTKAAAGIAGLIKATMAVDAQVLPPTTGVNRPHPIFKHEASCLRVLSVAEPWPNDRPVCAGVSAFGFGGINVHLTLQGAEMANRAALSPAVERIASTPQDAELFLLAATDFNGLAEQVRALLGIAHRLSYAELSDLAAALARQPGSRRVRGAVVASTPDELRGGLDRLREWLAAGKLGDTDVAAGIFLGANERPPRLAFLFPGQASPVRFDGGAFARRFPAIGDLYARTALAQPGRAGGAATVSTENAQPAVITAEIAGLRVLDSVGVQATAAVGHSLGELAALHWAGALDEEALLELAKARGRAMGSVPGPTGAMAVVAASALRVEELLEGTPTIEIAGINGPDQTVITGEAREVDAFLGQTRSMGIQTSRLPVSHAFHSKLMLPARPGLAACLDQIELAPLSGRVFSTVTGGLLSSDQDLRGLLVDQLTRPVRFTEALTALLSEVDLCVEVGPGTILAGLVEQTSEVPVVSLDIGGDSLRGYLAAVAAAYAWGAEVDAEALFADRLTRPFSLDWQPSFLANPCSLPGDPEDLAGPPSDDSYVEAEPAAGPTAAARPKPRGGSSLEALRQAVASRAELPPALVSDDSRLLGDLHLNSITVGQIVADVAHSWGLGTPVGPTDFAEATLGEIATALDDLVKTGGADSHAGDAPDGLDVWTRPFEMAWIEQPLPAAIDRPAGSGGWTVFGSPDDPDTQALQRGLQDWGGGGVAVRLPRQAGEEAISALLNAARAVLENPDAHRYFVVCQQAAACGSFARTLHLEHPDQITCVLDVPENGRAVDRVLSELAVARGYHEVRYDADGRRWVPELRLLHLEPGASPLQADDVLLVSGGGKGIAAECAVTLAKETGLKLALLGRSSPDEDSELSDNLERFSAMGIEYRYMAADVTDHEAVQSVISEITALWGPVTAILHGAGVNRPALIRDLDDDAIRATCSPKLDGLRNILTAIEPSDLRLLVNFGSVIARSGMRGEGDYALANEWLARESHAFQAAHPHCRCLTLEWSIWSGVGMGERLGRVEALAREGIAAIPPDQGIAILRELLNSSAAGAVVIMGRVPDLPTLHLGRPKLPLLRFIETPRVHFPGIELIADAEISIGTDPYLDDHILDNNRLLPGVMGLEAMAQAAVAVTGLDDVPMFEGIEFARPIVVSTRQTETVRVLALVRKPGVVDLAVRCGQTGFTIDHLRARCRFGAQRIAIEAQTCPNKDSTPLPLDPETDLYGPLLFHTGRFRRVKAYVHLEARACGCEIEVNSEALWFGTFLPQTRVLGDPGARDAAIHAVQACIPDARLLPVSVDQIITGRQEGCGPWRVYAQERGCEGDAYDYDLNIYWADGELCEIWRGLRLRKIEPIQPKRWALPLLSAHLEREMQKLIPETDARVVLNNGASAARRERSDAVAAALLSESDSIHRRADGKRIVADGRGQLSVAHAGDLTLAVASAGNVACDLEPVQTRSNLEWEGLLGPNYGNLAQAVSNDAGESACTAATRIWAARECLKKSGARFDAPLTLTAGGNRPWVLFNAGEQRIATFVTSINGTETPMTVAILAGDEHARL